jgi:hypothetical protein
MATPCHSETFKPIRTSSWQQWCGSGSGSRSAESSTILVEAEVEAPENMPLPLPLCFKVAVQILGDFLLTKTYFFQILFDIYLNYVQIILLFLEIKMLHVILQIA